MPERILRAATVVLHRAGAVFLVERPASARFFPSVWAFPGGKVDASDGDGDPAFRRGAIRELHEETGLDVGEDAHLAPAGRLLTPPFGPIRFDTQFFLLEVADAEEPAIIPGELVQGRWVEPARAVAEFERGLLPLAPPTLAVLRLAAAHGLAGAAAVAQATDGLPHHRRFRIEVAPGIYTLPLPTRTLPPATSTNAVVYGGASVLVVDPGPSEVEAVEPLLALLRSLASEGRRTRWVALTHHHPDHVGGLLAVAEETGAEVCAHAETEKRLPFKVDRLLADGDAFDLGTWAPTGQPWRVEAFHTPGHAPGHLAFVDRRSNHVAAGDLVSGVSTILVDPPDGDMIQYMASLERILALAPSGVLPAHGPPMAGARLLAGTLEHRRMRERLALEAIARGLSTPERMLPHVYGDTPEELWPLAKRNLLAHLRKLEAEGKARIEGCDWRLTDG